MNRLANWDTHLVSFARDVVGREFEWGVTDCATLVRRGLIEMLGRDVLKGHHRVWKTRRGALMASRVKPQDALKASGAERVGNKFAWSGDVAVGRRVDDHGMIRVALLLPTRKALTSTPDLGVIIVDRLSLTKGTRFWRYGG